MYIKNLLFKELDSAEKYFSIILIFSSIFFSLGDIADMITYIIYGKTALIWINAVCLVFILAIYWLYKIKKLDVNRGLLAHIAVVSVNLYLSILHEAKAGVEGSLLNVVECMCVSIIPAMLSGMTRHKWLPLFITSLSIACYTIAGVAMGNPESMLSHIPAFVLAIVGIAYSYSFLINLNRKMEGDNIRISAEHENILNLLDFTPKQRQLIKEGRMSKERFNKLIFNIDKSMQEKMIYEMRDSLQTDEQIKQSIRAHHVNLTAGEMELCVLIVKGKTVTKIAQMRGLHLNSITSQRSRLRTKLGIPSERNLNDYLCSLVENS